MSDDRGSAAITVVALMPLLVAMLASVIEMGALRVLAARVSTAADLAVLAATGDQDEGLLIGSGRFRLAPDAVDVARRFFAANLEQVAAHLVESPQATAARADIAAFEDAPTRDSLTGWRYDRPTVRIAASVPVRVPLFGAVLLPPTVTLNVRAASAAR